MGSAIKYLPHYSTEERDRWEGDWELIKGIPYAPASPVPLNQKILSRLGWLLIEALKDCHACAPYTELDYYISEDTVVRPDALIFCGEPGNRLTERPEMVFEIISEASKKMDEIIKLDLYETCQIPYYVIIYPEEQRIKVFVMEEKGYTQRESEISHFQIKDCDILIDFKKLWDRV